VYRELQSIDDLREFMEAHVFAVWDFMSLLKSLQRAITCVTLPWVPPPSARTSRLINEIVTGEESDEDGCGGYASHFELYREAMREVGAHTGPIDHVVEMVRLGQLGISEYVPQPARAFVDTTFELVRRGRVHELGAAFTFGREDVLPNVFRKLVDAIDRELPGRTERLRYYLVRHIEVDEGGHNPLAMKMLEELCGDDGRKWDEARVVVSASLAARVQLWDNVCNRIQNIRLARATGSGTHQRAAPATSEGALRTGYSRPNKPR
jgi:hypothetical protein